MMRVIHHQFEFLLLYSAALFFLIPNSTAHENQDNFGINFKVTTMKVSYCKFLILTIWSNFRTHFLRVKTESFSRDTKYDDRSNRIGRILPTDNFSGTFEFYVLFDKIKVKLLRQSTIDFV